MNSKPLKVAVIMILALITSCDEPETVVTDIVHTDGSVTRRVEMKNTENKFDIHKIQVPFDSTWIVRDSLEFDKKGDTTWVKRAEKQYRNIDEINMSYRSDSGCNKSVSRRSEFKKRFRWFNTEYRFAEIIEKEFAHGYPVSEFLNKEELAYFFLTEDVTNKFEKGPDSLRYKAFSDTISSKTDKWTIKSAMAEWIGDFSTLTGDKATGDMTFDALKAREDELVKISMGNSKHFDSLWTNGIILKEFIGEPNAIRYKTEADSAINLVSKKLFVDFHRYTVRIIMPGRLIGTNGSIDSTNVILWPVKSEYFLTQPYEMWAESKEPNKWAWIVTGIFLLFVLAGIIFKSIKRAE
ncbi:MAG TPA: hypothetical protein VFB97_02800 [Bacteroidales bacterium]|nr:hypothetical protein [Bacteroidales bacterium]